MRLAAGSGPRGLLLVLLIALAVFSGSAQLTNNGAKEGQECPAVCNWCTEDGACQSCNSGSMQVGGASATGAVKCVKCEDPLCEECGPAPGRCKSCFSFWNAAAYYSNLDTSDEDWPIYRAADGRCRKCTKHPWSSGCNACDRSGRCSSCNNGYALTAGGACKKCKGGPECTACDPATLQCTACSWGTGLDAKKQCRNCAAGLDTYGFPKCDDCAQDYRVCKECAMGYYADASRRCQKLPEHCEAATTSGTCTRCWDGYFLTAAKKCVPCGDGCRQCASATTCAECDFGHALTPAKTCLECSTDCAACTVVAPGQTRCSECNSLSLIDGECRRCDDPRCAECPGDVRRCKVCRNPAYVVNRVTGRCQDPSWPAPCGQPSGGAGRRPGCGTVGAGPQKPRPVQGGRRLQGPVVKPAIINGQNATRGRFPYLVSLRGMEDQQHSCGGALVHERVVLTAAHCLMQGLDWDDEDSVFAPIRIGGYERDGGRYEARRPKWAVLHPAAEFVDGYVVNDFALLLLDRPSIMRPLLRLPPAVPRPAAAAGTPLTAVGWGVALNRQKEAFEPDVLQEAVIDMLPLKDCAPYFGPNDTWDAQFCAGRPEKRVDTCQGDSGGPLLWKSPGGPAGDVAVGIVSWGRGCAGKTPGVYADVAFSSQWIQNTIQWMLREDAAGRIPSPPTKPA